MQCTSVTLFVARRGLRMAGLLSASAGRVIHAALIQHPPGRRSREHLVHDLALPFAQIRLHIHAAGIALGVAVIVHAGHTVPAGADLFGEGHQTGLTLCQKRQLFRLFGKAGAPACGALDEECCVHRPRGELCLGQRRSGVLREVLRVGQPAVHRLLLDKVCLGDGDLAHAHVLVVELQRPVCLVGELVIRRGGLVDLIAVKGDTVRVQDEGAVIVQDIGAACLGRIILGVIRGDDLRVGSQDGTLTQQEAVVVGAVIGAAVIFDHDQTVDGGQADFLLQHVGDYVLVVVQQAHLLVFSQNLGVHHQQAELAGEVAQGGLLHINQLVGSDTAGLDGQGMVCQPGQAQNGIHQLNQQALLVHAPVASGVAGNSGHGVGCSQLTGQLGGLPCLHAVDADPGLLAAGDLGGHVVSGAITDQRGIGVGIQRVIETDGAHRAAVVQRSGQTLVACQNAGGKDGIGEGGLLVHEALIDLGVKRKTAKSAGDRHSSVTSLVSCSSHQSRELLEKCRIAGAQGHAFRAGHLEKLLQGGLCTAALAAGLRDDDRVALGLVARLRAGAAVRRCGSALLEQIRLAGFEVGECLLNILSLILALAQCSSVRQQCDRIVLVQGTGLVGRSTQHTGEGELRSLLAQLVGQVGDLTAQIVDIHAVEGRQTLLCSGQLRLQALYGGLVGGFVLPVQAHDLVDLLFGQALDGSQILTSHGFTSRRAYSFCVALPCALPSAPLVHRARGVIWG
nr:MAG TPA: hypothetical protein [Caudoviricetes sp.]